MQIEIKDVRQLENKQAVRFTLTDDEANVYRCNAGVPLGADVQSYLDGKIVELYAFTQMEQHQPWIDRWNPVKAQAETDMAQSVLYNKSDVQIESYINSNVTTIATIRAFLKILTKEVRDIVRRLEME